MNDRAIRKLERLVFEGDLSSAEDMLTHVKQHCSLAQQAHVLRLESILRDRQGNFLGSKLAIEAAIELEPQKLGGYSMLADALMSMHEWPEAMAALRGLIECSQTAKDTNYIDDARASLAFCLVRMGDVCGATEVLAEVSEERLYFVLGRRRTKDQILSE